MTTRPARPESGRARTWMTGGGFGGAEDLGRPFVQGLNARPSRRNPSKQLLEERRVDAALDLRVQRN